MSKKLPITVITNTINAEGHLHELFDSALPYVEDYFVVDSRSTDKTIDICLARGVKVVQRPFKNPSDQFGWEVANLPVKTPWLFILSQDERFSESLVEDLNKLFSAGIPDAVDCVAFKWRLWFMGDPLHAKSVVYRMFRTGHCHVTNVAGDEHFYSDGKVLYLNSNVEHKDTLTLHEWYDKQNLWTTLAAVGRITDQDPAKQPKLLGNWLNRKMFFKRLLLSVPVVRTIVRWLHYYMVFGAWQDGLLGLRWVKLRMWVEDVTNVKEKEFRKHGIPNVLPMARHGDFDPRILKTRLQKQLLPETCKKEV